MENKKQHILENVCHLYLKFGVRGVTMDDVAREFGISKKTLYQYFNNKEGLVHEVIEYYLNNPVFTLSETSPGNSIDRMFALRSHVAQIITHFNNNIEFDLKKQYPDLYQKMHEFKRQRIYNDTLKNIEKGIKEGLFRPEIEPRFIAQMQVGMVLFTFNPDNEIFEEHEVMSIELFDKAVDYQMHAICTEKGLKYYKEQLNKHQNGIQN